LAMIVTAALAVSGVALGGGVRPDDRKGVRGVGTASPISSEAIRPDDRTGVRSIGAAPANSSEAVPPDDRGGVRGVDGAIAAASGAHQQPGSSSRQPSALETVGGFDWAAAAAGAGSAAALIALITAAAVAIVRGHRSAERNA
jgi:hypothetical protein